jgi:hypothetical protein
MSPRAKLITTLALLLFLGGLGATDYFLSDTGGELTASVDDTTYENVVSVYNSSAAVEENSVSSATSVTATSSAATTVSVVQPSSIAQSTGVKKQSGPDVQSLVQENGYTTAPSDALSFIAQVAGSESQIHSLAILQDGDRAGSVTWVESADVKNQFIALKEALLTSFSPQVRDLKDETLQGDDLPVRNQLSFFDPSLSTEKLFFVRVRERLFEFHITNGKDEAMKSLIEAITTK